MQVLKICALAAGLSWCLPHTALASSSSAPTTSANTVAELSAMLTSKGLLDQITIEGDGSISLIESQPFAIKSMLEADENVVLNLGFRFAKNSANLTADGSQRLGDFLDGLKYLTKPATIEISPRFSVATGENLRSKQQLAERRTNLLKTKLQGLQRDGLTVVFATPQQSRIANGYDQNRNQEWQIQIRKLNP